MILSAHKLIFRLSFHAGSKHAPIQRVIRAMRFVAVIPARGGSKGIPRKNVLDLGGRPLIAWTIDAALSSAVFDRILVSTDDHEIADVGRRYGAEVPFLRPAELATDEASSLSVVRHAVDWYVNTQRGQAVAVMLLQPTSPFRTSSDIRAAVCLASSAMETDPLNVVSVKQCTHDPRWSFWISEPNTLQPLFATGRSPRRQDAGQIYQPNGAIYVSSTSRILGGGSWYDDPVKAYVMPEDRSIDIDSLWDFEVARLLGSRHRHQT